MGKGGWVPIDFFFRKLYVFSDSSTSTQDYYLSKSIGTRTNEDLLEILADGTNNTMRKRERDLGVHELVDIRTSDLFLGNFSNLDDLDRPETSSVTGSHILIARGNSISTGKITIFFVHIVCSGTGVVTEPDTKSLDSHGFLFKDFVDRDDFARSLLDLGELLQEVPETGLGDSFVGSEDTHSEELRNGFLISGSLSSDDLIFV